MGRREAIEGALGTAQRGNTVEMETEFGKVFYMTCIIGGGFQVSAKPAGWDDEDMTRVQAKALLYDLNVESFTVAA